MEPDELKEMQRLLAQKTSIRAIARQLGRDPKTIRNQLDRPPQTAQPQKLEGFQTLIATLAKQGLTAPRILREIRERGYTGGLSILKQHLSESRPTKSKKVFQRFETAPAEESQIDWSPYRVMIGGTIQIAHCFSMILCYSRRLWIGFFRNERLPTLLYAHEQALNYHHGSTRRLVYDNQTTVTLGRVAKKPLWHPSFLAFANSYGFTPYACRVRHPERKGKVERPFSYIESDFLLGTTFESWEDLNRKAVCWLETVANVRKHSTTAQHVDVLYAEERPFLIALPELRVSTAQQVTRTVQKDGYIPVDSSFYPVPGPVGRAVTVRIDPARIEILDHAGNVELAYPVPDSPRRLPTLGQSTTAAAQPATLTTLETSFLAHFPNCAEFLDGLKRRMTTLTPIHLRRIDRLRELYGVGELRAAIERALQYRNFNSLALARILEKAQPNLVPEPSGELRTTNPHALGALDDADTGSLADYTFDSVPPTQEAQNDSQE